MRILVLPLTALSLLISPMLAQMPVAPAADIAGLYIPAVLHKGIRADKARPGDKVRLDLLEALLVGHGLVIPANAHLRGHIVETRALTPGSESRLSVEVDRVVWRDHQLPLHAFIYGLGIRQVTYGPEHSDCDQDRMGGGIPEPKPNFGFDRLPQEPACNLPWDLNKETITLDDTSELRHLRLETRKFDGSTTLISRLKNVHLSGGILIILRNVALPRAPISSGPLGTLVGQK